MFTEQPTRRKSWPHAKPRFPQEEHLIRRDTARDVRRALLQLDTRDRLIMCMRFGVGLDRQYILEDVGKELGISKERVRQLEKIAMKQLQTLLHTYRPDKTV